MIRKWTIWTVCIMLVVHLGISASTREREGGKTPMVLPVPPGFPPMQYDFSRNRLTREGFELGRKLFYEGRLSKDGNFPCASCHQQFAAFATYDHDLSHGFNDQFTTRNAPPLFNLAWNKEMHWDGGINNLEVQPLAPLTAPNEMAEDIGTVIKKLRQDPGYRRLFKAAFGDEIINSQRMLKALAQFLVAMVSANSRYDKMKRGELAFNQFEQKGYEIFQTKCTSCHKEPLFTDLSYRNTGLSLNSTLKDVGRMRITGNPEDSLKFRVPSLRNVMLTAPYGHDGRFFSVSSVLDHYTDGVIISPTIDSLLRNRMELTPADKYYLQEFLYTLTDSTFVTDKRFAMPEDSTK